MWDSIGELGDRSRPPWWEQVLIGAAAVGHPEVNLGNLFRSPLKPKLVVFSIHLNRSLVTCWAAGRAGPEGSSSAAGLQGRRGSWEVNEGLDFLDGSSRTSGLFHLFVSNKKLTTTTLTSMTTLTTFVGSHDIGRNVIGRVVDTDLVV